MTDTELALLRGVCAAPADNVPRLAYADYLDETAGERPCEECNGTGWVRPGIERCGECEGPIGSGRGRPDGRAARAEFIRLQIDLANRGYPWPLQLRTAQFLGVGSEHVRGAGQACRLLERHVDDWWAGRTAGPAVLRFRVGRYGWSRGFLSVLAVSPSEWRELAPLVYWRPDLTVLCQDCKGVGMVEYLDRNKVVDHELCYTCATPEVRALGGYRRGTGRVSVPCPPTALPLEMVRLIVPVSGHQRLRLENTAEGLQDQYPGVAFKYEQP